LKTAAKKSVKGEATSENRQIGRRSFDVVLSADDRCQANRQMGGGQH
jgi:hypothetical protein